MPGRGKVKAGRLKLVLEAHKSAFDPSPGTQGRQPKIIIVIIFSAQKANYMADEGDRRIDVRRLICSPDWIKNFDKDKKAKRGKE